MSKQDENLKVKVEANCNRPCCNNTEMVEATKGFMGIGYKDPKYPEGWKNIEGHWFCPSCTQSFSNLFSEWLQHKIKKE